MQTSHAHTNAARKVQKISLSTAGEKVLDVPGSSQLSEHVRSLRIASRRNERTLTDEGCEMWVVTRRRRDM